MLDEKYATVEELDKLSSALIPWISSIKEDIADIRLTAEVARARLEALMRFYVCTNDPKMDKIEALFFEFEELKIKLKEIITKSASVPDRVQAALLWNATSISLKIYADDLQLLPIIESVGGVSKKIAEEIKLLPYSSAFNKLFSKYDE